MRLRTLSAITALLLSAFFAFSASAQNIITADTTGDDAFTDPSFYGVQFIAGNAGSFIQSVSWDVSIYPDAYFDFDGDLSFGDAFAPVLDLPALTGLGASDISFAFTGVHPTLLTANFAPGSFGTGDSFRFAADTDLLIDDPTPGGYFGLAGVVFSVTMYDTYGASGIFETVSDRQSIVRVEVVPEPAAATLLLTGIGAVTAARFSRRKRTVRTSP